MLTLKILGITAAIEAAIFFYGVIWSLCVVAKMSDEDGLQ